MSTKNITPEVVDTIESALEERKSPSDRRKSACNESPYGAPENDRRSGEDRREKAITG